MSTSDQILRRAKEKLEARTPPNPDGLDWARKLRDRERRGDTLTEANMQAWRTALHDSSPVPRGKRQKGLV